MDDVLYLGTLELNRGGGGRSFIGSIELMRLSLASGIYYPTY